MAPNSAALTARGSATHVLLLPGFGDETTRAGTVPRSRVEFFTKPFTSGEPSEQIQRLLAASPDRGPCAVRPRAKGLLEQRFEGGQMES